MRELRNEIEGKDDIFRSKNDYGLFIVLLINHCYLEK